MVLPLILFGMAAVAGTNHVPEAAHAIAAGRLDQARALIAQAVANGNDRTLVDRLVADLAFAERRDADAFAAYRALLARSPGDALLIERAAICALRVGDVEQATAFATRATAVPGASWRAWNAAAVAADLRHDWAAADAAYERAAAIAGDQAELLNNWGWSRLLRGEWHTAVALFEKAVQLQPSSARIADNLELARAAVADELPRRRAGESDADWAARLNDAGVVALLLGNEARATAAFAQAIEARGVWYARAWNNLQLGKDAR